MGLVARYLSTMLLFGDAHKLQLDTPSATQLLATLDIPTPTFKNSKARRHWHEKLMMAMGKEMKYWAEKKLNWQERQVT